MASVHHHHIKALTPTWFLVKVTPAPAPRDGPDGGGKKAAPAAYSPLLLSPAAWRRAQDEKKKKRNKDDDAERADGDLPASPRISCMGKVKGRRGCSSARGPAPTKGSRYCGAGGRVANLVLGLFGMRRNARTTSRACAKVRDVPRATASAPGSTRGDVGVRRGAPVAAVGVFGPPLPVARRPATDDNAPSLWERRRGGRALEGLQLT